MCVCVCVCVCFHVYLCVLSFLWILWQKKESPPNFGKENPVASLQVASENIQKCPHPRNYEIFSSKARKKSYPKRTSVPPAGAESVPKSSTSSFLSGVQDQSIIESEQPDSSRVVFLAGTIDYSDSTQQRNSQERLRQSLILPPPSENSSSGDCSGHPHAITSGSEEASDVVSYQHIESTELTPLSNELPSTSSKQIKDAQSVCNAENSEVEQLINYLEKSVVILGDFSYVLHDAQKCYEFQQFCEVSVASSISSSVCLYEDAWQVRELTNTPLEKVLWREFIFLESSYSLQAACK